MAHEVVIATAAPRPLAVVRRQVRVGEVATAWRPALDQVWAFLRRHDGLRTDGHNIFVYHHPAKPGAPMEVHFGVEVTGPFDGEGEVVFAQTPSGPVASTTHVGSYDTLADAHGAIDAWRAVHGHVHSSTSWEIYGDPGDDPATVEVQVVYLLA